MSVSIGYTYSFDVVYEFAPPPAGCKAARKVCVSFFTFLPTQYQSPSPQSQGHPPAEPQLLHSGVATCIGRRIQLSRPAALLQDPLAPLPPPPCIRTPLAVLYCAAQQVLVAQYTGPGFSQSSPVSQSVRQSVSLAGGSRRSSFLLAVRGSQGPQPGMLVGASPATQGSGPKHLLSSPLAPGGQGSRPHLFGACDSMPFPSSPLLLVSACPFSTCPQPVLTSLSPSCKLLWSAALVLLGLLLSHQGLYADNLILLPRLIQLTLARTHTHTHITQSPLCNRQLRHEPGG